MIDFFFIIRVLIIISRLGFGNVISVLIFDFCYKYFFFFNVYDCYYYNVINGFLGSVLYDCYLLEGWYRVGVLLDMFNIVFFYLYCGIYFLVWMDGKENKYLFSKFYYLCCKFIIN